MGQKPGGALGGEGEQGVTSGGGVTPPLSPMRRALAENNDEQKKEKKLKGFQPPELA